MHNFRIVQTAAIVAIFKNALIYDSFICIMKADTKKKGETDVLISTRGRYALRVLLDLAENQNDGYIAMKNVAERQGLSLKYMERIMPVLSKNNYVEGVQGKGGGYRLSRAPKDYRVGDILRLAEGDLAPVGCLECGNAPCDRAGTCKTLPMWKEFHDLVNRYFDGITLEDLLKQQIDIEKTAL